MRYATLVFLALLLASCNLTGEQAKKVGPDRSCSDFSDQWKAQITYEDAGPGDPYDLDKDDDGVACESLP
jgi:hypothetical protein